jgi:hypothetical protein
MRCVAGTRSQGSPNRMGRHFVLDFGPELSHTFALLMTTSDGALDR